MMALPVASTIDIMRDRGRLLVDSGGFTPLICDFHRSRVPRIAAKKNKTNFAPKLPRCHKALRLCPTTVMLLDEFSWWLPSVKD